MYPRHGASWKLALGKEAERPGQRRPDWDPTDSSVFSLRGGESQRCESWWLSDSGDVSNAFF